MRDYQSISGRLEMKDPEHRQWGFTLLELSIVLVIIGLLAGGIIAGRQMIRASELRAVMGEIDGYIKATKMFQDKYLALPGDMKNAEDYWGSDAGCPNTASNTVKKTETCNGNGDGRIGILDCSGSSEVYEWFRVWQQLSSSGLIEGKFTGAPGPVNDTDGVIGLNLPASKMDGVGYSLAFFLTALSEET
jgi:prepilin-type N-terminal cleavage/methylation domain-containing protein